MITGVFEVRLNGITYEDVHFRKHVVCLDELVGDTHSLRLHGMMDPVGVGTDVGWENDWMGESGAVGRGTHDHSSMTPSSWTRPWVQTLA